MEHYNFYKNHKIYYLIALTILTIGCNAQEKFGGLALYTVREEMEKNPEATIKSVAEAGYKYIEAAGYENGTFYKMTPLEFKALLEENKLN